MYVRGLLRRHPVCIPLRYSTVRVEPPIVLNVRLKSTAPPIIVRGIVTHKSRPPSEGKSKIPAIDFDTMGAKELDKFLKAAELAKVDLSSRFDDISCVIARSPRFESPSELSRAAFILRMSDGSSAPARRLLDLLSMRIYSNMNTFNAVAICKCMAGLRLMSSDNRSARSMVGAIATAILKSTDTFGDREFGQIIYSLKGMNSDSYEIRKLIKLIADKIEVFDGPLDSQCIGNMLYGLRRMSSSHPEVKALVSAIAFKVPEMTDVMKPQELGNAIYGLQNMSSSVRQVRELVFALSSQISRYVNQFDAAIDNEFECDEDDEDFGGVLNPNRLSNFSLSAQELSNALYGLQNMSDTYRDTRIMLSAILPPLKNPASKFTSQAVGLAVYGLQSMSSESKEVRAIVDALATQISRCSEPLNSQAIGNALYGLKSMNCQSPEVRRLLAAIAEKIRAGGNNSQRMLSSQAIGNALYGLKNMNSDTEEVIDVVMALTDAIAESSAPLSSQSVGNAIYGLGSMKSNAPAVLRLVDILSQKVSSSPDTLSGQAVSNALYGMQNLSSSRPEVRNLLGALAKKIYLCEEPANGQTVGNALYGLKSASISDGPDVREIVGALAHYFYRSSRAYGSDGKMLASSLRDVPLQALGLTAKISQQKLYSMISRDNERGVIPLNGMSVGMALFGLRGMSSACIEVQSLLAALIPSIKMISTHIDGQLIGNGLYGLQGMSTSEVEVKTLANFFLDKIDEPTVGVMSGQEISNAFFGLQGMEPCAESNGLLISLGRQLSQCSDIFSPVALSECFFGMQQMPLSVETVSILRNLNRRFDECVDPFEMSEIGRICYALKSFDDSSQTEIEPILNKLFNVVLENNLELSPQHCGNIFYGLRRCPQSGKSLINHATEWCLKSYDQLSQDQTDSFDNSSWMSLCQSLQFYLDSSPKINYDKAERLQDLCLLLNKKISRCKKADTTQSKSEASTLKKLKEVLGPLISDKLSLSVNEYLYCFESDIVIRSVTDAGRQITINVEVDGAIHSWANKKKFCKLRDEYLRNRHIHVVRIEYRGVSGDITSAITGAADEIRDIMVTKEI